MAIRYKGHVRAPEQLCQHVGGSHARQRLIPGQTSHRSSLTRGGFLSCSAQTGLKIVLACMLQSSSVSALVIATPDNASSQ